MEKKRLKLLVIAAIAVMLIIILLPGYTKLQDLVSKNKRLEAKVKELTKYIEGLEAEKEKLEGDILYIEKVAREKLGVAREDEVVIEEKVKE